MECNITELLGKVLIAVNNVADEDIHFVCEDGSHYKMYHAQD